MSLAALIGAVRRHRTAWRVVFTAYALVVIGLTHWPRLQIPGAEVNSDKVAHFGAYLAWASLAFCAGFFGPAFSRYGLLKTGLVALLYSLLDETSQLIPVFGREASFADAAANAGGVLMAYALAMMVIRPGTEEPLKST